MRAFNSTIKLKEKICVRCGNKCIWFSKKRCKDCARIEDAMVEDSIEDEKDESFMNLVDDLDFVFSRYIRLLHSDEKGIADCYTSGVKKRWQELQCGHFVSRGNYATRWLVDNCRPQTEFENCHLHGNLEVFRKKLNEEKPGLAEWLEEQGRQVCKPSRDELKQLISEYRFKVKLLEAKIKKKP